LRYFRESNSPLAKMLQILADRATGEPRGRSRASVLADGVDVESLGAYEVAQSTPPSGPLGDFEVVSAAPPLPGASLIQLVQVAEFDGLLVDFCRANGIDTIVRSLRSVSDFDYELQIAQMNYRLSGVETVFMTANPQYSFLSSSLVREIAQYHGDVSNLVTPYVQDRLREKYTANG
jgi:hypothetical protein